MITRNTSKTYIFTLTLIVIFTILLSACGQAAKPAPTPTQPPAPTKEVASAAVAPVDLSGKLTGPLWMLLGYGDAGNPNVVEPGVKVTTQFAEDGSLSGFGGCNSFFGPYKLNVDKIEIGPLGSTMMACENGMNQESIVTTALQQAYKIAFTPQGRLEIFYDSASSYEKKLVFTPSQKSLADTLWVLESFGKPDNPSTPETGTIITAQFSQEGILSGMTGCNNYTTSYTVEDGRMEIKMPATTMRECTIGMEQEAAYLQALPKAESYQIDGTTLEISYDGGLGVLRYTSQHYPLENVLWTLVAMNGEVNLVGQPITALFEPGKEPGKGTVGGAAMCNTYIGAYTQEKDTLKIEKLISTLMSCQENVMQAEATYLETLGAAKSYQIYGETLIVTSEKGILTYSAKSTPLEGVFWHLDSMGTIESPTIPSKDADFTALFFPKESGPAGLVLGWTGCNEYNAAYVANLTELKVNLPNLTNNTGCPPDFWEQEQQYFLGLNAASTYHILGNKLQIPYDEGRQALNFTAEVLPVESPSGGPLTSLNGTRWWLVMLGPRPVLPGTQTTAVFAINDDGKTGTISGNAGCNDYNAPITGALQIGQPAMTKKYCPEPPGLMNQESAYLSALQTATSFTQVYNQLLISTRNGLLVFYHAPAPLQPIVPPQQPRAVIQSPVQANVGQVSLFDGSQSTGQAPLVSWHWEFGDGRRASGQIVQHAFGTPGMFAVQLTVTDLHGQTNTSTRQIVIVPPPTATPTQGPPPTATPQPTQESPAQPTPTNEAPAQPTPTKEPPAEPTATPEPEITPPQASISAPASGYIGEPVKIDASGSHPGSSPIVSYTWSFGNGAGQPASPNPTANATYNRTGLYEITVVVADSNGQTSSATAIINIDARLDTDAWTLSTINGQPLVPDTAITLQFLRGEVAGFTGCNDYNGTYTATDNLDGTYSIKVGPLTTGRRACQKDIMDQEEDYMKVLQTATSAVIRENRLTLSGPDGQLVFYLIEDK